MNKMSITLFLIFIPISIILTQTKRTENYLLNLKEIEQELDEIGIPNPEKIAEMENKLGKILEEKRWKELIKISQLWERNANLFVTLIEYGLTPYYDASYDVKNHKQVKYLIENYGNTEHYNMSWKYYSKIVQAILIQAHCNSNLGNQSKAIALYARALKIIDTNRLGIDHSLMVTRELYKIIGIEADVAKGKNLFE